MQLPSDDPKKRNPDIRKAKKYLDWEPKFSLEEGLKQTIVYFRELYEEELKSLKNPESTSAKKEVVSSAESVEGPVVESAWISYWKGVLNDMLSIFILISIFHKFTLKI